jgi:hypothetical protein
MSLKINGLGSANPAEGSFDLPDARFARDAHDLKQWVPRRPATQRAPRAPGPDARLRRGMQGCVFAGHAEG